MAQIKTNVRMAEWVWSLDRVEAWVSSAVQGPADLGVGFCSLKRWLTQEVGDEAVRTRAVPAAYAFLQGLEAWIKQGELDSDALVLVGSILNTLLVEAGPYRYETKSDQLTQDQILAPMAAIRQRTVDVYKAFLGRREFDPIRASVDAELVPLVESVLEDGRFMPFRLIQAGKIAERMGELAEWLEVEGGDHRLVALLKRCYDLKYPRFGTSGLRGRWGVDFTEIKARQTALAICQYLNNYDVPDFVTPREDLSGKWMVIGYDGRRNSTTVADWLAEVALANGLGVYMACRPTPTPAIAFFATEYLGKEHVASIMNCTASHNPSDWQGIKFNPKEGYPAPTHLTNLIAERVNEMQLIGVEVPVASIQEAEAAGRFRRYDPLVDYWAWIKNNGKGNRRIPVDFDAIHDYFGDKLILIDEMHGAGRGYMQHIFGELGLRFEVLHAQRDIDLGGLAYANPERPFIDPLIEAVRERGAAFGMGLDTDADRFGVVDEGGEYYRPNQVLAMLSHYLGKERKLEGRLVITQTGLPMIDALADQYSGLEKHRPAPGLVPPYVGHRFYIHRTGERETMVWKNVFVVPVGIKYIVEIPRMDEAYRPIPDDQLGPTWMDELLLGGEESSGLTTRGHVPDKDGLWANLLIMDMIAHYKKPLRQIWQDLVTEDKAWESYGGRVDIDASDNAKERLISYYLDLFEGAKAGEIQLAGCPVLYAGGTRFDMAEIFMGNRHGQMRNFLRVRASGTEPINRIYAETEEPTLWKQLFDIVLEKLDSYSMEEIKAAYRIQRIADILAATQPSNWERVIQAVLDKLAAEGWRLSDLRSALQIKHNHVEKRNQRVLEQWLARLGS